MNMQPPHCVRPRSGGNLIQVSVPSHQHASASACAHGVASPPIPAQPYWRYGNICILDCVVYMNEQCSTSIHACYIPPILTGCGPCCTRILNSKTQDRSDAMIPASVCAVVCEGLTEVQVYNLEGSD